MAAVWACCVGVQAEDVGCFPSPSRVFPQETSEEDPTPPTMGSPHTSLMGPLLLCRGFTSRGIHALERTAFAFLNTQELGQITPTTPPQYTHKGLGQAPESLKGKGILACHPKLQWSGPLSTLQS